MSLIDWLVDTIGADGLDPVIDIEYVENHTRQRLRERETEAREMIDWARRVTVLAQIRANRR